MSNDDDDDHHDDDDDDANNGSDYCRPANSRQVIVMAYVSRGAHTIPRPPGSMA